ncbi:hypothetical protein ACFQH5_03815 [Halomonas salifodinae]|uniref:Sel1 repeat family protein n=1 Tax=Halomonas salifodinae TaxID=438745 RepID=A0ABW2EVP8_9GAMM
MRRIGIGALAALLLQVADDWLERAGEAGHAESQYWLGILIGDGLGDYPDEAQREEVAEAWLRLAHVDGILL